jgi:hypothetical protein
MKFIEDVVSGKLLLGNYARLAVERHLNDLKNKDWEYTYSEAHANEHLTLSLPSGIPKENLLVKGLTSNLSRSFS